MTGLIVAGAVELLSLPVVDSRSVPAGDRITVTFVSEKSRLMGRTFNRRVLIGSGNETLACSPSVLRALWKFADARDLLSLLRQAAAETRDPELARFMDRHRSIR